MSGGGKPIAGPVTAGGTLALLTGAATLAAGAMLFGAGTATLSTLAIGSAGQALTVNPGATAPQWSSALALTSTIASKQTAAAGVSLDHNSATGNFTHRISPANLTANRRTTLPDADLAITGGGTIALGGFTLTVPATGSAALLGAGNAFTGANTFTNAAGIVTRAAATQDGVTLLGRAGGTSSYSNTITTAALSASRTLTLPDADLAITGGGTIALGGFTLTVPATGSAALLGAGNAFTGANTFTNAAGVIHRAAATQDGIKVVGRAGGTSSYTNTLTTATLSASRTLTLPDADLTITGGGTIALGGFTLTVTATGTAALLGAGNAFTGANTFTNAAGVVTRAAATQDGMALVGRAGGTSSYLATISPPALTASRTWIGVDASDTFAFLGQAQTFSVGQNIDLGTGATGITESGSALSLRAPDATLLGLYTETWGTSNGTLFISYASGGTRASPTATPNGYILWGVIGRGHTGSAYSGSRADYLIQSGSLWTVSSNETYHGWFGTPSGSITNAEWMRLQGGSLLVGATALIGSERVNFTGGSAATPGSTAVTIGGGVLSTGGSLVAGGLAYAAGYGALQLPVSTALAGGISWAQDTFLYRNAGNSLKTDGAFASTTLTTTSGGITIADPPSAGNRYILSTGANDGTQVFQNGPGSSAFGGAFHLHGSSHATRAGWVGIGLGISGAKFAVTDAGLPGGTDVFTVSRTGVVVASGKLAANSAAASSTLSGNTVAQVITWLQSVFA